MILASVAIRRPVFTAMVVMAIVVFGLIALRRIGTDLFPRIDFPVVTVLSALPGADPETVEGTVSDPIEEAVSSISGIKSLRSTSAEDISQVVIEFNLDKDVDVAFQEVQARLAAIRAQLPRELEDPVVEKLDLDAQPVLTVYLGGDKDARDLTRIAKDVVKVRLQQVRDVGQIRLIGGRERTMWIHLDRDRLAGYGLAVEDVVAAVRREHADIPGGRIETGVREWSVSAKGEFSTAAGFAGIIVSQRGGTAIRLADLGRIEDGVQEQRSAALLDGREAVALEVRRQSGTNTVAVAQAVKEAIGKLQAEMKPQGIELRVAKDTSLYIEQSIHEIQFHLIIGGLFAVITVYLFLRNLRITAIAALAIPTAVMGAFACIQAFGFTLNMMTMLALTLSIGILIDDAIVVLENVYRRYEGGLPPLQAANEGTAEIGLAAVAITLSIVAVFVPVAFMDGIVGRFFFQFGITVTAAVLISLFVAFTLTPTLAARLLGGHGHGRFYLATERMFTAIETAYAGLVRRALHWRWATLGLAVLALVGALVAARGLRSEFAPIEDQSEFMVLIKAPVGTPLATTRALAERIRGVCTGEPWLDYAAAVVGGGELGRVNEGSVYVKMRDLGSRTLSQQKAMAWVRERLAAEKGANLAVEAIPRVSGGGFKNAMLQVEIRGRDLAAVQRAAQGLMAELRGRPGYVDIDSSWEGGKPEVDLRIDRERAAQLGVAAASVGSTVRWLVGGDKVGTFRADGSRYDVRLRLAEEQRNTTADIGDLAVRGAAGRLVALRDVMRPEEVQGPSQINRYSRTRQVTVYANFDGKRKVLGDAITETTRILDGMKLPAGVGFGFAGQAEVMDESFANLKFALGLAVVMVYMVLASQFESFWQPLVIMLSLPLSLVGALGLLVGTGQTMSIFVMIGIIMLFGLVTKNAILLVDFTNTLRRRDGLERDAALAQAGGVRLRPILMTTLAMIAGMAPVALGTGAGSESRAPMAIAVIGGLVASTLLTLVVVPVVYSLADGLLNRKRVSSFGLPDSESQS